MAATLRRRARQNIGPGIELPPWCARGVAKGSLPGAGVESPSPADERSVLHVAKMLFRLPQAKHVYENPSPEEVKELAAKMRTARPTKFGNLNVQTEVLA